MGSLCRLLVLVLLWFALHTTVFVLFMAHVPIRAWQGHFLKILPKRTLPSQCPTSETQEKYQRKVKTIHGLTIKIGMCQFDGSVFSQSVRLLDGYSTKHFAGNFEKSNHLVW